MASNFLNGAKLKQINLNNSFTIKPFDCGDDELNNFLFTKAADYRSLCLATTFVLENEDETLAYFSILNDSIKIDETAFSSKSALKRFLKKMLQFGKRHLKNMPALKIGRLAIHKQHQGLGIGKILIEKIIIDAIELNNQQACKLITVDAYQQSLAFYKKNGSEFLSDIDLLDDTRQMYFDLPPLNENKI